MKVALGSTYFDIEANGLRMLSAVLRRAGHPTKQIFLPKTGDGLTWLAGKHGYSGCLITTDLQVLSTDEFDRHLAA